MKDFNLGDFVTIVCEIPHGLCGNDSHTPHVKGNLGIITEVYDYKSLDGFPCFWVKDSKGHEFAYAENELIPAFETDIRRTLRELLERR